MIDPDDDDDPVENFHGVVTHSITVEGGQAANVLVNDEGAVAFVYGDVTLPEATLVIRARCPFNADALRVRTCECSARSQVALDVVRRAPLGVFVYLPDSTVESFAEAIQLLAHVPAVERLFIPFPSVGDVALLRDATEYELLHAPTVRPPFDVAWPLERVGQPRWYTKIKEMLKW